MSVWLRRMGNIITPCVNVKLLIIPVMSPITNQRTIGRVSEANGSFVSSSEKQYMNTSSQYGISLHLFKCSSV